MNQFFSVKRFSLLVAKHWADNKKRYGLAILAFAGLLIGWFVLTLLTFDDAVPMSGGLQQVTYFFTLFIIGTFYASQYFRDLGSRPKGINFLMVPASTFEKLLCSILFSVVLFFVAFTGVFYIVDGLMMLVAQSFNAVPAGHKLSFINVFKVGLLKFNVDATLNFLMVFFGIQSAFLLGSVYFEKYSFIKTIIAGFVGFFILFCVMFLVSEKLLPNGDYPSGFLTAYRVFVEGPEDKLVQVPRWIGEVFRFTLMYAVAPFLWIVTYYRLKEKQV